MRIGVASLMWPMRTDHCGRWQQRQERRETHNRSSWISNMLKQEIFELYEVEREVLRELEVVVHNHGSPINERVEVRILGSRPKENTWSHWSFQKKTRKSFARFHSLSLGFCRATTILLTVSEKNAAWRMAHDITGPRDREELWSTRYSKVASR